MNSALVKPSKAIKSSTSTVRSHLDAVERARQIYLNQIKRAEAEYFERIKHATKLVADEASTPEQSTETEPQPEAQAEPQPHAPQ